jgi:hypothetical protein
VQAQKPLQTSFGFGFGSPSAIQKVVHRNTIVADKIPTPLVKNGIGSTATEFVFTRFNSRGMSVRSPLTAAGGIGMPVIPPHSGGQLKPLENKYNISFCTPIGSKGTGINLDSSQDMGKLEGNS